MREMHWDWWALHRTPAYVRRFTWDCLQARREAEDRANEPGPQQQDQIRVKW